MLRCRAIDVDTRLLRCRCHAVQDDVDINVTLSSCCAVVLSHTEAIALRDTVGAENMRVDALLGTWEVIVKGTEKYINATERFRN